MTYAESAHRREVTRRRTAQDRRDAVVHRALDLSAQDTHMKYERASFSVVGEGSRSANINFREGYQRIRW